MKQLIKTSALTLGVCMAMAAAAQAQSFGYGVAPSVGNPNGRCLCPPGACAAGNCSPYCTSCTPGYGSACAGGACGTMGYAPYSTQSYRPSLPRPTHAVSYAPPSYGPAFQPAGSSRGTYRAPVNNTYGFARHW